MATEKMDRRVRKTRALLLDGLIQLMEQKDIQDISVKELSDLVDINRGTFYLHYSDIYDMLHKIEDELFMEFNAILDRDLTEEGHNDSVVTTLQDIFSFLEKHRDIARVMLGPHGDLTFTNHLKDLVKNRMQHTLTAYARTDYYEYYSPFIISGFIGVIETWLQQPDPQSPKEMAKICSHMLTDGMIEKPGTL